MTINNTKDNMTEENATKPPRTLPSKVGQAKTSDDKPKNPTRKIVVGKETFEVEVDYINGRTVLAESLYKEVPLPGTKKTTQILVLAKGTPVQ